MTAGEYLANLQNLTSSLSHSEPIPEDNKDFHFKFEEMLSPETLKEMLDASEDISTLQLNAAYPSISLPVDDYSKDRCDVYLELLNDFAGLIKDFYSGIGVEIYNFPLLGVLPIGTVDAVTLRVPDSSR
ncbi:MAG: hypothetical protein JO323_00160, partial [Acidobacteriia bacterium]|nr:hypothetical protein [Terriglobia bacterium]